MQLLSCWNLIALCLLALVPPSSAEAKQRLRGRRQQEGAHQVSTFRITVFDHLIRNEQDGSFSHEDELISIPIIDGVEASEYYSIELPDDIQSEYRHLIETGKFFVSIAGANIQSNTVTYSDASEITALDESPIVFRKLNASGSRKVAILRVSLSSGPEEKRQVSYTVDEIRNRMFENEISLKNHMKQCSNGKLLIEDAGVHEVTVEGQFTDFENPAALRNKALEMFAARLQVGSAQELYDHVVVILPPNEYPGFVGNAGVNHWVSTLNDIWSLDVMVYMHEFGHNIGLNHAWLSDGSPDYSSYMSATGVEPNLTGPLKCYNGASNRQMGWFEDRTQVVDVLANPAQLVPLAAFSEASKTQQSRSSGDAPILIEIGNYTLQYNFASEFNKGTELLQNLVTVAHSEASKTIVEKEGLEPQGITFSVDNFEGSGKTLKIEACDKVQGTDELPNTMMVGISLGLSGSPCDIL